jgi:GTPase involved in cell partitioning and DNA repair
VCSYDIKDSLLNLSKWYQQYNDNVDISNKQMMIFVNKNDLDDDEREFNIDDVKEKSKEMGIKMVEVSSLEGNGIEEAFNGIIKTLVEKMYEGGDNKTKERDNEGEVHSSCVVV